MVDTINKNESKCLLVKYSAYLLSPLTVPGDTRHIYSSVTQFIRIAMRQRVEQGLHCSLLQIAWQPSSYNNNKICASVVFLQRNFFPKPIQPLQNAEFISQIYHNDTINGGKNTQLRQCTVTKLLDLHYTKMTMCGKAMSIYFIWHHCICNLPIWGQLQWPPLKIMAH